MTESEAAAEVVRAYWDRTQARDWVGVAALLAPDVVVEWPASGERMNGRGAFVAVNQEYPEGWSIRVVRVIAGGDTVVSEVEVPHDQLGASAVSSWWRVDAGLITHGREYWITPAGQEPPAWRARYAERYDGRPG